MNLLFFISISVLVFSTTGLAISLLSRRSRTVSDRFWELTESASLEELSQKSSAVLVQKQMLAAVRWIRSFLGLTEDAKLLDRFNAAGLRTATARDSYFAARILGPALGIVMATFMPSRHFFWITVLGGVAYLLPDIILTRMVKKRRNKIQRSLPDTIDLLVICVEAGLGLDQAILRVGQELAASHPQINEELLQINREQRAGKPRLDAWQAMADRTKLQDVERFTDMLMQTERFGTPIARALSNFSDGIRQKRRQRAEELAAKTTVKIIFPLVLFIFPSMFIVLLGPAGITIARGMTTMVH